MSSPATVTERITRDLVARHLDGASRDEVAAYIVEHDAIASGCMAEAAEAKDDGHPGYARELVLNAVRAQDRADAARDLL